MGKRKLGWTCGITVLFVAGGLSALGASVKHEPNFYQQNRVPPSEERKKSALTFVSNFGQMMFDRQLENWDCQATDVQLNSFFEEVFIQQGEMEGLRNMGISSPTVNLEKENQVRLAFRYGSGWFSTVISYDLKIWLVPKEANVIAVEVLRARAGALPISNQTILHQLSEFARKQNFKVSLYRHESNAVAIIDLQGDQQQPKNILTTLSITTNSLLIRGKTLDHALAPHDLRKNTKVTPQP